MGFYFLSYFCGLIFIIAAGLRIYRQLKLPLHLRWELYPVKHEAGPKAEYGGSYMEELNWWQRKRKRSFLNEIKFMLPEIFFLRGVKEENPKVWQVSFPFHFGLYMLMGTLFLLFLGALASLGGSKVSPDGSGYASAIYYLAILLAFLGLTLGTAGSTGLLYRRWIDLELRNYSSILDYFNLFFFLIFFLVSLLTWLFHDHNLNGARDYILAIITFGWGDKGFSPPTSFLGKGVVILASLLIAYIPLTHMAHMFMKYFLYHSVRWEDEPNLKGGVIEREILKNLGFKPTWAAAHIAADGRKSWVEIASPARGEDK